MNFFWPIPLFMRVLKWVWLASSGRLDTCRVSNASNGTGHCTEAVSYLNNFHLCDRLHTAFTFSSSRFLLFFFFFFFSAFVDFGGQILLLWTVYALFTHCACTVHVLKNIKNGSHDTIYTFKNYFTTVFSVFSFQFSVFSNNKLNPNGPFVFNCQPKKSRQKLLWITL